MSNEDKKPAPPRQPLTSSATTIAPAGDKAFQIRGPEYTPVALARFSRPIQYPGRQSDPQVKTERMGNGQSWEVEYLHDLRHMRITFSDPARKVIKVGYVPIEQVLSWDPLT